MEVRLARDPTEVDQALRLRERVFCGEQGVDLSAERDGHDSDALHLVALEGSRVVGTCRLVLDGRLARLGRMAVDPTLRRRGVGAALLEAAERAARAAGAGRVALHAQTAVRGLYARGGYVQQGETFVEEGIDHVTMERALA